MSSATYAFRSSLAVFLESRFLSWRISSRFLRRARRLGLPLMCSFSFSVSALHPPRWLRNHRRMNGSVLPRSRSPPPGRAGVGGSDCPVSSLPHPQITAAHRTLRLLVNPTTTYEKFKSSEPFTYLQEQERPALFT